MKRKEFIIINVFLVELILFFGVLTVNLSANQSVFSVMKDALFGHHDNTPANADQASKDCTSDKQLTSLSVNDPQLAKLAEYQRLCGSLVTNQMMFFTTFIKDDADASAKSTAIAQKLQAFHKAGVSPIVIAEPYVGDQLMSYRDFMNGAYDSATDSFFAKLKDAGITDQMMGMWVPFPESNTPSWNNKGTEPNDFALCVNKYLGMMKKYFPNAKGSVLLNSATYEPEDTDWANGDYLDLTPYLQNLDKNLVSSIGIQGFPWVSSAGTQRREIFKASEFLQPDLAINAARELHTRDIWFNTGTFARKYTNDSKKMVEISANERRAILNDILTTATTVQNYQQNEYRVSINLFSEDKSYANETTDWSYMQDDDSKTIFEEFVQKSKSQGLPISLFDQTH